ncbi:hypothetical protein QR685DRAFT_172525 [Neurospora intermedia]|uniref:Uncharacterized protein n=1 Tax=Neurospora intermedia TaxID=5142 RepID=A0ABR3DL57_NEUIN
MLEFRYHPIHTCIAQQFESQGGLKFVADPPGQSVWHQEPIKCKESMFCQWQKPQSMAINYQASIKLLALAIYQLTDLFMKSHIACIKSEMYYGTELPTLPNPFLTE